MHDAFISYATEDNDVAFNIAYGLRGNGLSTWFAPISLRVGDNLIESIDSGLRESRSAIIVVSQNYLAKKWTSHEMNVLTRQHIEGTKKLLPIWLDVTKKDVESRSLTLGGIVSIADGKQIELTVSRLIGVLSDNAPSRGVIPVWEDPAYRFLKGLGEVNMMTAFGSTTNIFEFTLCATSDSFPFWLGGKSYTKRQLLTHIAEIMAYDRELVEDRVGASGVKDLRKMCIDEYVDPDPLG